MSSSISEKSWKGFPLFLCGICMGIADLIPGISGGTIAFIMGFYFQLLESIKSCNLRALKYLLKGRFKLFSKAVEWPFLLTLGLGITLAFVSCARFLQFILNDEIYRVYLYATFTGLILASFGFCLKQIPQWRMQYFFSLLIGAFIAFILTSPYLALSAPEKPYAVQIDYKSQKILNNYDFDKNLLKNLDASIIEAMHAKKILQSDSTVYYSNGEKVGQVGDFIGSYKPQRLDLWLVFCGSLAICALLLPGISGSYILTLLGVYSIVIGALADLVAGIGHLNFDRESFYILSSLGLGIVIGLLSFSRFISWLLQHYHNFTIALLAGFMIGAMRSIWPFWSVEYALNPFKIEKGPQLEVVSPYLPSIDSPVFIFSLLFAIAGFAIVFFIEMMAKGKILPEEKVHVPAL